MNIVRTVFMAAVLLCLSVSEGGAGPQWDVVTRYEEALRKSPGDLSLHYGLGVALLSRGQDAEAVEALLRAYPDYVDSMEANFNLALAHVRLARRSDALVFLAQAEELGAALQPELYPLGELYFRLAIDAMNARDLPEASYLLERTLATDPSKSDAHLLLGEVEAGRGELAHAEEHFGAYLEVHPDDPEVLQHLATARLGRAYELLESGGYEEAQAVLSEVLAADPANGYGRYYLGYLHYLQGERSLAVQELSDLYGDGSAELLGAIRVLLHNCAAEALKEEAFDEAQQALAPLLSAPSPDTDDLFLAGNLARHRNHREQAREYYRQVLARQPEHRGARVNLVLVEQQGAGELVAQGRKLLEQGALQEALSTLEAARARYPAKDFTIADLIGEVNRKIEERSRKAFLSTTRLMGRGELFAALDAVRAGLRDRPDSVWGQDLETEILYRIQRKRQHLLVRAEQMVREGNALGAHRLFRELLNADASDDLARQGAARTRRLMDEQQAAGAESPSLTMEKREERNR